MIDGRWMEAFDQGSADESGALGDVFPRVLVHASTDVLEFVPALSVMGSFGWAGMAVAAGDLHHDTGRFEEEVDAGDLSAAFAMDDLGPRPWQSCFPNELQEPALEHRVSAGVDEQALDLPAPPPA